MPPKKKEKRWKAAAAQMGVTAKGKTRKAPQAQARRGPSSRRKMNDLEPAAGLDISGLTGVDAMMAEMGGDPSDDDSEVTGLEDNDGGDSDSSAGAFHDLGSDDEAGDATAVRGVVEDLEDEEGGEDAGLRHEEELRDLKEKDPEFYRFLVEQDRQLLDFSAPPVEEEEEEGEAGALQGEDFGGGSQGRVVTKERLDRIRTSAKESFTACKAALNIYHTAVRSIGGAPAKQPAQDQDDDDDEEGGKKKRRRGKKQQPQSVAAAAKARKRLFTIEDESIFSEVIEWSIANLLGLFRLHAGEVTGVRAKEEGRRRRRQEETGILKAGGGVFDPSTCKRWSRIRSLAAIFWEETYFLLHNLVAQEMLEFVLRHISTPEALCWLWPFRVTRSKLVRLSAQRWATAPTHSVRLLSFLFLRNVGGMLMQAVGTNEATPQLEALVKLAVRAFITAASRGYGWKSVANFRFMENSLIELLRLEDATAYRSAYVCLRQLALVLRNASLNIDPKKTKAKEKGKKGQGKQQEQPLQALIGWPFIRSLSLWTRAVSSLPSLRPLSYPLYMVALGAAKHRLTSMQHFPFVYHCLSSLNQLGSQLEAFVPISSLLVEILSALTQAMEKSHHGRRHGGDSALSSDVKAPDIEVSLRFSEAHVTESLTLETIASGLCYLITDHLGLLSQSVAFPEITSPVLLHLRKGIKRCRSEALRRQLKSVIEKCEASAEVVRTRREALSEAPDPAKFLLFEADTAIAKARAEASRRRAAEEKTRVEAEAAQDPEAEKARIAARRGLDLPPELAEGQNAPGTGTSRYAKRRARASAAKGRADGEEAPAEEEGGEKRKKLRSALEQARRTGSLPDRDKVEEMDFGGGDDDDEDA